jgi:hypothetical protein
MEKKNTITQAENRRHQQLKNEFSTLVNTVLSLQEEKKENM